MIRLRVALLENTVLRFAYRWTIALLFFAGVPAAALAQDTTCRNGLYTHQPSFAQAQVISPRAFFYEDTDGCPARPARAGNCRKRSYVIEGDMLVVGRQTGAFFCAFYPNDRGGTAGWVKASDLRILPTDTVPALSRWVGDWTDDASADVIILSKDGRTYILGEAFWPARPGENTWPTIHIGEVNDRIAITGNRATYGDDNLCELELTLLRDFLLIADNMKCGGANVTFGGVYTRSE